MLQTSLKSKVSACAKRLVLSPLEWTEKSQQIRPDGPFGRNKHGSRRQKQSHTGSAIGRRSLRRGGHESRVPRPWRHAGSLHQVVPGQAGVPCENYTCHL